MTTGVQRKAPALAGLSGMLLLTGVFFSIPFSAVAVAPGKKMAVRSAKKVPAKAVVGIPKGKGQVRIDAVLDQGVSQQSNPSAPTPVPGMVVKITSVRGKKTRTVQGKAPYTANLFPGKYSVQVVPPTGVDAKGATYAYAPSAVISFAVIRGQKQALSIPIAPLLATVRVQMPKGNAAPVPAVVAPAVPAMTPVSAVPPATPVVAPVPSTKPSVLHPTKERPYPVEAGKALLIVRAANTGRLPDSMVCMLDGTAMSCQDLFSLSGLSVSPGKHTVALQRSPFDVSTQVDAQVAGQVYLVSLTLPRSVRLKGPRRVWAVEMTDHTVADGEDNTQLVRIPQILHIADAQNRFDATFRKRGFYPERVSVELPPLTETEVNVKFKEDPVQQASVCSFCGQGLGFLKSTIDFGTGYPDVLFGRFKIGLLDYRRWFRLDAGLEVRSFYWDTTAGLTLQAQFFDSSARLVEPRSIEFSVGARTFLGAGGGNAQGISANNFMFEVGIVPTLKVVDKFYLSLHAYYQLVQESISKIETSGVVATTGGAVVAHRFVLEPVVEFNIGKYANFYLGAGYAFGDDRLGNTSVFAPKLFSDKDRHIVGHFGFTFKIPTLGVRAN